MEFDRTGFILYTLNYQACVQFYEHILDLDKLFETPDLTCFSFGSSYLMVEEGGEYAANRTENGSIKSCLRMNVPNVKKLADELIAKGISVDYQEHTWGTVAKFFDPDGNLCSFKDSAKFENQIWVFKQR
ncbi:MAG TPA: hypothetical protein P5275_02930 [Saprospiraceae bacterium]|nr:hypothetical protein [Saprospiraceae bacterium]